MDLIERGLVNAIKDSGFFVRAMGCQTIASAGSDLRSML